MKLTARVALIVALAGLFTVAGVSGVQAAPPPGLTPAGRVLWNFEALLHDTFGSRAVCQVTGAYGNGQTLPDYGDFVSPAAGCDPTATYSTYVPVFANAHGSAFHLVVHHVNPGFGGAHSGPVRVHGLLVACDQQGKRLLIAHGDAVGFSPDCEAP